MLVKPLLDASPDVDACGYRSEYLDELGAANVQSAAPSTIEVIRLLLDADGVVMQDHNTEGLGYRVLQAVVERNNIDLVRPSTRCRKEVTAPENRY
jgi:hypothetical protein